METIMDIGIVGLGVVGSALRSGFEKIGQNVITYDIKHKNTNLADLNLCDIIYICVPTPTNVDNSCDITQVTDTVKKLSDMSYSGLVCIKSTVIPGTTQKLIEQYPDLRICFVPEFLRELSALTDFVDNHDILIVGTHNIEDYEKIIHCHGIIPKKSVMIQPTAAEMTKYFSNLYNALRIIFANGIYEVCEKFEINYEEVFSAISNKSNIGTDYLKCDKTYRAYGGKCLPKDALAFLKLTQDLGLSNIKLFSAIVEDNEVYKK